MQAKTTDLCDQYAGELQVAAPLFRSYGGKVAFSGPISTVQVYEDNVLVRAALEEPGAGRVLVVDGGGSLRCALVGDQLAALGLGNGWAGVVINGCIRDVAALRELAFGVQALAATPLRSAKRGSCWPSTHSFSRPIRRGWGSWPNGRARRRRPHPTAPTRMRMAAWRASAWCLAQARSSRRMVWRNESGWPSWRSWRGSMRTGGRCDYVSICRG